MCGVGKKLHVTRTNTAEYSWKPVFPSEGRWWFRASSIRRHVLGLPTSEKKKIVKCSEKGKVDGTGQKPTDLDCSERSRTTGPQNFLDSHHLSNLKLEGSEN